MPNDEIISVINLKLFLQKVLGNLLTFWKIHAVFEPETSSCEPWALTTTPPAQWKNQEDAFY